MKRRHVPSRLCLGCGTVRPKRELVRVVRVPSGTVQVDPTGRVAGRGAYICPDIRCFEQAMRGRKLERALEVEIGPEVVEELRRQLTP